MRLLAALVVLGSLMAAPAHACDTIVGWVGVPLCQAAPASDVAVPDVVGEASFAAADAILEGDGLDGLELEACSAAMAGEIVAQNPSAGTLVALGTVVGVSASSGTECPAGTGRIRNGFGLGL
jgi:beta-lactam-binding protein with PASTA domain